LQRDLAVARVSNLERRRGMMEAKICSSRDYEEYRKSEEQLARHG